MSGCGGVDKQAPAGKTKAESGEQPAKQAEAAAADKNSTGAAPELVEVDPPVSTDQASTGGAAAPAEPENGNDSDESSWIKVEPKVCLISDIYDK